MVAVERTTFLGMFAVSRRESICECHEEQKKKPKKIRQVHNGKTKGTKGMNVGVGRSQGYKGCES
jgi:hypothetical protein